MNKFGATEEMIEKIKCPKCQSGTVKKLVSVSNIGKNSKSDNACPTCHL